MFSLSNFFLGHGNWQLTIVSCSNAEEMLTEKKTPKTSHTTNKVPFILINAPAGWSLKKDEGVLGDVAPTVLDAMGIEQPKEMSGRSLLVRG